MAVTRYFLGGNTASGFVSFYGQFCRGPEHFLWVIKGGPGCGKSTLMKCILGEMEADKGTVAMEPVDTIGYVEQQADMDAAWSLYDELKDAFADVIALAEEKAAMEA